MRRADRLLQILQIVRRRKAATPARLLADELGVALRTIYRDIADLQATRVPLEGEPGRGYLLRKGYDLPPLMFDELELEVLALGARMVADRGDPLLARAAQDALAKVATVLPDRLAEKLRLAPLLVPHRSEAASAFGLHLPLIRRAVREHCKLKLDYADGLQRSSSRTIWPLGLYFYSHVTIVCSWCELRGNFRAFRADRVVACEISSEKFNADNGALLDAFLKQWALASADTEQLKPRAAACQTGAIAGPNILQVTPP